MEIKSERGKKTLIWLILILSSSKNPLIATKNTISMKKETKESKESQHNTADTSLPHKMLMDRKSCKESDLEKIKKRSM